MSAIFDTREAYLTEALALIFDDILMPAVEAKGFDYGLPTCRVSVGFPKHSRGGKAIAVCHSRAASTDGVNEIFVNPEIDDPIRVLDCLVHEGIHAIDDCASGHRNFFAKVARAAGLEGPLTATHAGEALGEILAGYVAILGDFPHSKMRPSNAHKPDQARQKKVECSECGFLFRTSRKQYSRLSELAGCPVCDERGTLQLID